MKQFLLSAAFLLFTFIGFGQCPTEEILLTTQEEVDDFQINYPNCTELQEDLRIGVTAGSNITNLSGLSQITRIGEVGNLADLVILGCPDLTNLTGLDNLTFVGGDIYIDNTGILNLNGLGQLERVAHTFTVQRNPNLVNFIGVSSLTEVNSFKSVINDNQVDCRGLESLEKITGVLQFSMLLSFSSLDGLQNVNEIRQQLSIGQCNNLVDLDELSNVEIIGGLLIQTNNSLTSIAGLINADSQFAIANLSISNNPNLPYCSINLICENFESTNPNVDIVIHDNSTGCNTPQEVEDLCGVVFIPDNNFLDALVNHTPTIDTNSDDNIQFDEAEAFTGNLNVAERVISDFTGLEAFVNITGFNGSRNFMSRLSLESNIALTSVDFSGCPDVENVFMKNGNNTAITNFNALDCPSLEFICVDEVAFAQANFTNVDAQVTFVEDCEVLAVSDFNLAEAIALFPNPVSDNLTISIASNFSFIKAEVYAVNGQKLKETSAKQVGMSDLSAGIYFVKVVSEQGSSIKKIIKK